MADKKEITEYQFKGINPLSPKRALITRHHSMKKDLYTQENPFPYMSSPQPIIQKKTEKDTQFPTLHLSTKITDNGFIKKDKKW